MGYIKGRFASLRCLHQQIDNSVDHERALAWVKTCIVIHTLVGMVEAGNEDQDWMDELLQEGLVSESHWVEDDARVLKSSPGICEVDDDATVLKSALGMMPVKRSPPKSLAVPSGWVLNGLLPSLANMGSSVRRSNMFEPKALRSSRAAECSGGWKGISYPLASVETPADDKLSSRKFAGKLRDTKLSSIDIETTLNLVEEKD
ncbi:hypothetical protein DFH08DRAFT_819940 [Mycena albidolilacea]|uniref:Uncharacterized protein n=1 Tax=Mycena albidolilacea TaxID=1033008 RepID=A0AAD6ZDN4_9AGAR|nr:hypothetical protein DFH08DRAFT_819940 [Mycena albidolilacea]